MEVPYGALPRYEAAVNAARAALGLPPIGLGFPFLWSEYAQPGPRYHGPAWPPSGVVEDHRPIRADAEVVMFVDHRVVRRGPAGEGLGGIRKAGR